MKLSVWSWQAILQNADAISVVVRVMSVHAQILVDQSTQIRDSQC